MGETPAAVLRSVTSEAAAKLNATGRIGSIRPGMEANLVVVEGNPLEDIAATERISDVYFKGEHVDRGELVSPTMGK